jgi:hypothetical protein
MDGCEHYDRQSDIYLKWTNQDFAAPTASGRNGRGISLTQGGAFVAKTLNHQSEWVVGFAMNFLVSGSGGVGTSPFYASTNVDSVIAGVSLLHDWTVAIAAGNNYSGPSIISLHPNTWYYFEFKYQIGVGGAGGSNATVTGSLKVNGTVVCTCTDLDSGSPISSFIVQTATVDYHNFLCPNIIGTTSLDDVVIADCSGNGEVNDFFGDVKIGAIFPASDGSIQWTPTPSGPSFSLVNSQFPENSNGTISSNAVGQSDVFGFQTLPPDTGAIVAIHYGIYAKKDGEGTRAIQPTVGGSAVPTLPANNANSPPSAPYAGYPPPEYFVGDTYCYYFFAMDSQPGGAPVPWTAGAVNGTTFGVKITD